MWRLIGNYSNKSSDPFLLNVRLGSPVVAISISCLDQEPGWVRAGWLRPHANSPIGRIFGKSELLLFRGTQQVYFQVPAYPYGVEFSPRPWVKDWRIQIWSRDLEDEGEPTPTIDLVYRKQLDMEAKIDAL